MSAFDFNAIKNHLELLFEEKNDSEYIEIRIVSKEEKRAYSKFFKGIDEALDYLKKNEKRLTGVDVYVGINPRKERSGKDEDVKRAKFLVIDLDYEKGEIPHVEEPLKKIENLGFSPCLVLFSGSKGYHFYIQLEDWVSGDEWRKLQKRLIALLSGKGLPVDGNIHNPSRVMRLAGTINPKSGELSKIHIIRPEVKIRNEYVDWLLPKIKTDIKVSNDVKPSILKEEDIERIVEILKPLWVEGHRQNLSLWLSGFLRKQCGLNKEDVLSIISRVVGETRDEEGEMRLLAVEYTFSKNLEEITGTSGLLGELSRIFLSSGLNHEKAREEANKVVGEILEFLKKYKREGIIQSGQRGQSGHEDIDEELLTQDDEVPEFSLLYPTEHLPMYSQLDSFIDLYGDEYKVIKKSVWYFIHSSILIKKRVFCGNIRTDSRINFAYAIPSGMGKHNIIRTFYSLLSSYGLSVSKPTSFHPEQMVGKIVRRKKKKSDDHSDQSDHSEYEDLPGWFEDDVLLFNEAIDLLHSNTEKYKETRVYLSQALDPWPENEVVKKLVDVPKKFTKRFTPHFTCALFFQPYAITEEVVLQGFIRRFFIVYVPSLTTEFDSQDPLIKRVLGTLVDMDALKNELVKWLHDVSHKVRHTLIFTFSDMAKVRFAELTIELIKIGMSFSEKCARYINRTGFTIQERFAKMCAVHAAIRGSSIVEVEDVEKAFIDAVEFVWHELQYIHYKVSGDFDYGETWRGAVGKDREILEWLYYQEALSYETSTVSISDLKTKIMSVYGVEERQARRIIKRLKENGWIQTKKGQHDSKVWLAFKPQFKRMKERPDMTTYYELCERYCKRNVEGMKSKVEEVNEYLNSEEKVSHTHSQYTQSEPILLNQVCKTSTIIETSQKPTSKKLPKKLRKELEKLTPEIIEHHKRLLAVYDDFLTEAEIISTPEIGQRPALDEEKMREILQKHGFNISPYDFALLRSGTFNNIHHNGKTWFYLNSTTGIEKIRQRITLWEEWKKAKGCEV